jgi:alanine dehydrogenase
MGKLRSNPTYNQTRKGGQRVNAPKSIGFPRMQQEAGEKRVFLPEFIHHMAKLGTQVYIEEGYGSRSGYRFEDYKRANPNIYRCSREEAFQKDVSLMLRSPKPDEFQLIRPGSTLVAMQHFPTRPIRVARLKTGIKRHLFGQQRQR